MGLKMIYNTLNLKEATDEQLKTAVNECGRLLMYYMAAEGNYSQERKEREEVNARYYEIVKECESRNIPVQYI